MPIGYTTYACELDFNKIGTASFYFEETGGGAAGGMINFGPSDGKMFIGTAASVLGTTYVNFLDVLKTKLEVIGNATYTVTLDAAVANGVIPKLIISASGGGVTSFLMAMFSGSARNILGFFATSYSGALTYTGDTSPWYWIHQTEQFLSDWPLDKEESADGAKDNVTQDGTPYGTSKDKPAILFDAIAPCEPGGVIWKELAPKFNSNAYRAFTWEDLFPAVRNNGLLAVTIANANGAFPDSTTFVKLREDGCYFQPTLRAASFYGFADVPLRARVVKRTYGVYVPPIPPSFVMTDLGAKLTLWLPPAGLVLSGANITQWSDASGNSYHMTQATGTKQATATTLNGVACALFDGVDDEYGRLGAFSTYVTAGAGFMAAVVRPTVVSGTTAIISQNSAVIGDTAGYVSLGPANDVSGTKYMAGGYLYDSGNRIPAAQTITVPGSYYIEVRWDSSTIYGRVGATQTSTAASAVGSLTTALIMGRGYNSGNANRWFAGIIAEPIICNAVPSAGELTNIRAYYASTYGVTT